MDKGDKKEYWPFSRTTNAAEYEQVLGLKDLEDTERDLKHGLQIVKDNFQRNAPPSLRKKENVLRSMEILLDEGHRRGLTQEEVKAFWKECVESGIVTPGNALTDKLYKTIVNWLPGPKLR